MSKGDIIENRYIIKIENIGKGLTSKVSIVEDKETKKYYAIKILKDKFYEQNFDIEKEVLQLLKDKKIPNVINLISSGEFCTEKYLILDLAQKGHLYNFINVRPLKETYAKIFFKKILEAVKNLHNNGVYHRDLKTENILLDNKYNPIICDFGFSTFIKTGLKEHVGSYCYAAPELFDFFDKYNLKPYNGEKVDIFALGVILFNLVTGKYAFRFKKKTDPGYKDIYINIKEKNYPSFWKLVSKNINEVKEEFKELYVKMIAYKPAERPSIEKILKDKWLEEINKKSDKEIEDIEAEIYEDFLERESYLINKKTTIINKENKNNEIKEDTKGGSEDENNDFKYNLIPKKFREGKYLEYYNEIIGDLNPVKFMNDLTQKLKEENENKEREYDCNIEPNEYKLKFKVTFEQVENAEKIDENIKQELEKLKLEEKEENEEEEENEDNNRGIIRKDCSIQIELYENDDKKYLLRYVRKSGDLYDFYKLLKYINNCIDSIIQ